MKAWCEMVAHVDDDYEDPRDDRCWHCHWPISYTSLDELLWLDALLDGVGLVGEQGAFASLTLPA